MGTVHHRLADGSTDTTFDDFDLLKGSNVLGSHATAAAKRHDMPTGEQLSPVAVDTPESIAGREAQQRALAALQGEAASGGWSADERKAYTHASAVSLGLRAGHQAAAVQQMVARGMSPGLANSLAAKVGQQSQAQAGYQGGLDAMGDAEKRKQFADQAVASQTNQMQGDALQQAQFNATQQDAGALKRMAAEQGESAYDAGRAAASQANVVGGITTGAEGALGLAKAAT